MISFSSNLTNLLYYKMLKYALLSDIPFSESRVGCVKDLGSASYELLEDDSRIIFLNSRGFNPFFALAEFSWLISGSNLVEPLSHYISDYTKFSDDGLSLNGAYGYRLKRHFEVDQINTAIDCLRKDKTSRRVVLTMWHAEDLGSQSLDVPCNTAVFLKIRENKLDISVTCRSNDLYLGVPYNILLFYLLQKYIANGVGVGIGRQLHFADSLHLYKRDIEKVKTVLLENNPSGISEVSSVFTEPWADRFLGLEHESLLYRQFEFSESLFANLFTSFELCKSRNVASAVRSLEIDNTGLNFSAYQWFRERQSFNVKDSVNEFELLREALHMEGILSSVDTLKYDSEDEIMASVEKAICEFDCYYDKLAAVLDADKGIFKIDISQKKRNLAAIYLSLIYSTIDPMNLYTRDVLVHKLGVVAALYDLTCRDLLFLSSYETRFRTILNNKVQ